MGAHSATTVNAASMTANAVWMIWRLVRRPDLTTALTLAGLAACLCAAMVIGIFVAHKFSYDRHFPGYEDIYRISVTYRLPGRDPIHLASAPAVAAPVLERHVEDISHVSRVIYQRETLFPDQRKLGLTQDRNHKTAPAAMGVAYVDPGFLDIFVLPFVEGTRESALNTSDSLVLTRSKAALLFGDAPALGQNVQVAGDPNRDDFDGPHTMTVTGVVEDLPSTSHFSLAALALITAPANDWPDRLYEAWGTASARTYVRTRPGIGVQALQDRLVAWRDAHVPAFTLDNQSYPAPSYVDYLAQPVADIAVTPGRKGEINPPVSRTLLLSLLGVCGVLVVMAALNTAHLMTARTGARAQDIAMRKAAGADRGAVFGLVIGEGLILAAIALVLALAGAELLLPVINAGTGLTLAMPYATNPVLLLIFAGAALFAGALGAAPPALMLAGLSPARILKGANPHLTGPVHNGTDRLRTLLVALQFAPAIALAMWACIAAAQSLHAWHFDTGWERRGVAVLSGLAHGQARPRIPDLRAALEAHPSVEGTALSLTVPTGQWEGNQFLQRLDDPDTPPHLVRQYLTGPGFFGLYRIPFLAGQDLSSPSVDMGKLEDAELVINESALTLLGYRNAEEALGSALRIGTRTNDEASQGRIIGVVADFHPMSVHEPVLPAVFLYDPEPLWDLSIRFDPDKSRNILAALETIWRDHLPAQPFRGALLEDRFAELHQEETRLGLILGGCALLAMGVACLGLVGLASATVARRRTEIALRKALGARPKDILAMLLWQISKPVLAAGVLGGAVAYPFAQDWLAGFAHPVSLTPVHFLLPLVLALVLAWLTTAAHALQVARKPPAPDLRHSL